MKSSSPEPRLVWESELLYQHDCQPVDNPETTGGPYEDYAEAAAVALAASGSVDDDYNGQWTASVRAYRQYEGSLVEDREATVNQEIPKLVPPDAESLCSDSQIQRLPIFVYGTLRSGQRNHHVIHSGVDSSETAHLEDAELHVFGELPYATSGVGTVTGEVLYIDPRVFVELVQELDRFVGYKSNGKHHYNRVMRTVTTEFGASRKVWVYLASPRVSAALTPATKIKCGDWPSRQLSVAAS